MRTQGKADYNEDQRAHDKESISEIDYVVESPMLCSSVELSGARGIPHLLILPSVGLVNQIPYTITLSYICTLCHADRIPLLLFTP